MPKARTLALYALLFSSGAAGLIYEVCWSRQLGLFNGHGERASAITLGLFFGGMALGYAGAGRPGVTRLSALCAYALCEAWVSGLALLLAAVPASRESALSLGAGILLASIGMGASLPFAMQAVAARGASLAGAYAVHLFGATLGSLGTTFALIEWLGVWHSTYLAAALSGGSALVALLVANPAERALAIESQPAPRFQLAAAWAGACTLALEVLVLRLFALTFHNSTYTFGLTIGIFIVLLALGSRLVGKQLQRDEQRASPLAALGAFTAAFGVVCVVPLFSAVTGFGELRAPSFASYVVLAAGLVGFVLAVPVIAAGTLLPALWSSAQRSAGHAVGSLSAANSLGSAAGALLTTFVLLPRLGLFPALVSVAASYAALGLSLSGVRRRGLFASAALLSLGTLLYTQGPATPTGYELLQRWQSPYGWVDLLRRHGDAALSARLDLHYQLGSSADKQRHVAMGSLPLALHPRPRRVLFVGLATGMTASAALAVPSVEQVEVVELVPEVVELARRFAAHNGHLLDDPRLHVTVDDGRSYLARDGVAFDVIVADLFVPWHSHAGYLYTVEHYRKVRARLSASGVFAQWLPLWQLGSDELELIAFSLSAAFPHTSVWLYDADPERTLLGIMGHMQPQELPPTVSGARRIGSFRPGPRARLNTDEHPLLELGAPRSERNRKLLRGDTLRRTLAQRFPR